MGTLKTVKKATKKQLVEAAVDTDTLTEEVETAVETLSEALGTLTKTKIAGQGLLDACFTMERLNKLTRDACKAAQNALVAHHDEGGKFQMGKVVATVSETTRTSPRWKDEAIEQAEQVAALQGDEFDEVAFVESVLEQYEPTTSRKIKLDLTA